MRELKFRYTYKRKEDGKIYQEIVPIECLEGRGSKPLALDLNNPYWEIIGRDEYIGLKDKNGKEIYDGDIVQLYTPEGERWIKTNIIWTNYAWSFEIFSPRTLGELNFNAFIIEVIGNIYENPELLK